MNDAEVERLLTRDKIDLEAIAARIRESAAIAADVKVRTISALLQALAVLAHEQHMATLVLISQELQTPRPSRPEFRGFDKHRAYPSLCRTSRV